MLLCIWSNLSRNVWTKPLLFMVSLCLFCSDCPTGSHTFIHSSLSMYQCMGRLLDPVMRDHSCVSGRGRRPFPLCWSWFVPLRISVSLWRCPLNGQWQWQPLILTFVSVRPCLSPCLWTQWVGERHSQPFSFNDEGTSLQDDNNYKSIIPLLVATERASQVNQEDSSSGTFFSNLSFDSCHECVK